VAISKNASHMTCGSLLGSQTMPFEKGQAYVCIQDGRRAVVADTKDDGRSGLLRFGDTGAEEWFLWEPFYHAAKWQRMDADGWYIERCDKDGRKAKWHAIVADFSAVKALVADVRAAAKNDIVRVQVPPSASEAEWDALQALGVERL
jgi:hypothetical protein